MPLAKRLSISFSGKRNSLQSIVIPSPYSNEDIFEQQALDQFPLVPNRDAGTKENLPTPQEYIRIGLSPKSLPSRLRSATMTRSSAQSQLPSRKSRHQVHSFAEEDDADQTTPELVASTLFMGNNRYSSSGSSSTSTSSSTSKKNSMDTQQLAITADSWINSLGLCSVHGDDEESTDATLAALEAELYTDLLQSASVWGADEKIEQISSLTTSSESTPVATPSRSSSIKRGAPAAREKYESRPLPDAPTDVRRHVPAPAVRPTFSRQSSSLSTVSCPAPVREEVEDVPLLASLTCNGRVMEISGRGSIELSSRWSMDSEPEERLRHTFKPAALVGHFRSGSPALSSMSSFRRDHSRTPAMSRTSSSRSTFSFDSIATVSDSTISASEQVFDLTRPSIDYRAVYNLAQEYVQLSSDPSPAGATEAMARSQTLPSLRSERPRPTSKNLALKLLTKNKKSATTTHNSPQLQDRSYHLRRLA